MIFTPDPQRNPSSRVFKMRGDDISERKNPSVDAPGAEAGRTLYADVDGDGMVDEVHDSEDRDGRTVVAFGDYDQGLTALGPNLALATTRASP